MTAAGGLFLIVFGFDRAAADGWGAAVTIGSLVGGVALLGIFVLIEHRTARPLLPLRLLENRTRSGSYLAVLFAGIGGRQLWSSAALLTERPGPSLLSAFIFWAGLIVLAATALLAAWLWRRAATRDGSVELLE